MGFLPMCLGLIAHLDATLVQQLYRTPLVQVHQVGALASGISSLGLSLGATLDIHDIALSCAHQTLHCSRHRSITAVPSLRRTWCFDER